MTERNSVTGNSFGELTVVLMTTVQNPGWLDSVDQ